MSYSVRATLPSGERVSCRVGTTGALLFAGYSVAGRPDSRRVRGRWVVSQNRRWGGRRADLPEGMPAVSEVDRSIAAMRALIAFNAEGCTWVWPENDTIARGLQLKAPGDPILTALCTYWDSYTNHYGEVNNFDPAQTVALAGAMRFVSPHLATTCWYEIVRDVTEVFEQAAAAGVGVNHG